MPPPPLRYAVYFAPPADSPLARFGAAWLGRDADTGARPVPPSVPGVDPDFAERITAEPRRYGFHATLKPPFALAAGRTEAELLAALRAFAAARQPFAAPLLRLAAIGRFLALVPDGPAPMLHALADDCVRAFDAFRAPPSEEELARRRRARLTPQHEENLRRWGYPYVFESFRFHMTLTGSIADDRLRETVTVGLRPLVEPFSRAPLAVDAVTLFVEEDGDEPRPFRIAARFPFGEGESPPR
jgi:putative phosphonate metabolism protein